MKKEFKAWLFILALNLIVVIACVWDYAHREPIEEVVLEESESELIYWKDTEATEEVIVEDVEAETVTEPQEEVGFYNVPLSEELQLHIFAECEKHNIAPNIVLAIMWMESRFQEDVVSKYGDIGLMQVNPKWHWNRMERLGCLELYDPFQNITVGVDYLAELKAKNPDVMWVLMAYNDGPDDATAYWNNGVYTEYATTVLERASELEAEYATN